MDFQINWLKFGLFYGLSSIIIQLITYYVSDIGLLTQFILGLITVIIFMVLAGLAEKEKNNGVLSFGEAFMTTVLTGGIGLLLGTLFLMILLNVIDPGLLDVLVDKTLSSTKSMMETFGAPEDAISERLEKAEAEIVDQFSVFGQIKNLFTGTLSLAVTAAIVSLIIRKEEKFI
jgi:Protein of unknown function (DUF4199)